MEEEIVVKYGDKFVLRYYSPLETVGGGIILDPNAHKHKRFKEDVLDQLVNKSEGDKGSIVEATLKKLSINLPKIEEIISNSGISAEIVKEEMDTLLKNQIAFKFGKMYMHIATLEEKEEELLRYLNNYHTKHSLKVGVGKEEVRNKILKNAPQRNFDEILKYFEEKEIIKIQGAFISIKGFEVEFSADEQKKADKILDFYKKAKFTIPNLKDVLKEISLTEKDRPVLDVLVARGDIIKIDEFLYIHSESIDIAKSKIIEFLNENGKIALGEFRDLIGTSRKVAVPILEYFDSIKLTIRVEDKRAL
jgi:selenocysteine-specific elongation factor